MGISLHRLMQEKYLLFFMFSSPSVLSLVLSKNSLEKVKNERRKSQKQSERQINREVSRSLFDGQVKAMVEKGVAKTFILQKLFYG